MSMDRDKRQRDAAAPHDGANYVSEYEAFMDHFLEDHPDVARDQVAGMNVFWNRDVNFEDLEKAQKDSVPVKGYDYF